MNPFKLYTQARTYAPARHVPSVTLTGDELACAIRALQRSSEAMPDGNETFLSREVRQARETKLATRLRAAIARSI